MQPLSLTGSVHLQSFNQIVALQHRGTPSHPGRSRPTAALSILSGHHRHPAWLPCSFAFQELLPATPCCVTSPPPSPRPRARGTSSHASAATNTWCCCRALSLRLPRSSGESDPIGGDTGRRGRRKADSLHRRCRYCADGPGPQRHRLLDEASGATLYGAKANGCNRVVRWTNGLEIPPRMIVSTAG